MKKILITGGAGFIGIHTSLELTKKGYKVLILDNLSNSNYDSIRRLKKILANEKKTLEEFEFIKGDVRDEKLLNSIFEKHKNKKNHIFGVIHFAGLKSVSESINNPLDFWDNNFLGTLNLLKTMVRNDCKKFVFSSSATVYGSKYNSFLKESFLNFPINPYGDTKNSIEKMLHNLHLSDKKWSIVNLRYFNPIGAHESGLIGENSLAKINNLFPEICEVAAGIKNELKIYGSDWPSKDGTPIRDFVHVMDIAAGHINAMKYLLSSNGTYISLNLGTGKKTTVLELVKIFEKVNGLSINYSFSSKRKGDPYMLIADVNLAKKLINWNPKKTLEEMCIDGWRSYLLNMKNQE